MDGKRVIGVDVGKRWLDVAREGVAKVERHANEAAAIAALVASLDAARDVVVFERTGGYERALEAALAAAGVPWAVVHSARVKAFRQVQGIEAKTDAIDARLLRAFGRDRLNAGALRLGGAEDVTLDALMVRRRQLKAALHAERCRLETAALEPVRASIERMIAPARGGARRDRGGACRARSERRRACPKEAVLCGRIGRGTGHRARAACRAARARPARRQGDRRARRPGAARAPERRHADAPRPGARSHRRQGHPLQTGAHRHAMGPGDRRLLRAPARTRQARQGRSWWR